VAQIGDYGWMDEENDWDTDPSDPYDGYNVYDASVLEEDEDEEPDMYPCRDNDGGVRDGGGFGFASLPESDAHPPLEPVDAVHYVVCADCGDPLGVCTCALTVTDHPQDGAVCGDCRLLNEVEHAR
jgi:hypothetical protein